MTATDPLTLICRAAHLLWCRRMKSEGWKPGPFNPARKTHDALVPYARLKRHDRFIVRRAIGFENIPERLLGCVEYQRGPDRELLVEEMRKGMPIESSIDPDPGEARPRGTVASWTINPRTKELELITVRWADGQLTEHGPAERELQRVE